GADRRKELTFGVDGLLAGKLVIAQGVFATGSVEAFEQGLVLGVQVNNIQLDGHTLELFVDLPELSDLAGQVAGINTYRDLFQAPLLSQGFFRERGQQAYGKIVDAVESNVLQNLEGGTFTGDRKSVV